MLHYAERMSKFGPIKHLWAMRFESVHCKLKQTDLTCKKNILKTLSFKEQTRMNLNCQNINIDKQFEYNGGDVIFEVDHEGFPSSYLLCEKVTEDELYVRVLDDFGYDEHFDGIIIKKTNEIKKIKNEPGYYTYKIYQNINNTMFLV